MKPEYIYTIWGETIRYMDSFYVVWECPFSGESKFTSESDGYLELDFMGNIYLAVYYNDNRLNEKYIVKCKV